MAYYNDVMAITWSSHVLPLTILFSHALEAVYYFNDGYEAGIGYGMNAFPYSLTRISGFKCVCASWSSRVIASSTSH